jgi:tRNA(Ile)-lysidine synthase
MLMRLARGSGAGGLAAPRPVQVLAGGRVHLRPLLGVKKAELVAALRQVGIAWREDASNTQGAYFRNRIRRDVIPVWLEAAQRDGLAGAARSRTLLEEDDAALEALAGDLNAIDGAGRLQLAKVEGQPRAIWRRVLHHWLLRQPEAGELSRQAFEALLVAIECGKPTRQSLGRNGFAVLRSGCLRFSGAEKARPRFHGRAN